MKLWFLGLHAEGDSLSVALLRRDKKKICVEWVRSLKANVKPLYILAHEIKSGSHILVTGLESKDVLMRTLHLNLPSRKAILAALPFQLEGQLPFPVEGAILQPAITWQSKKKAHVSLLATSEKKISSHLQSWARLEVDPDQISSVPLALFRFAKYLFPKDDTLIVIHLGSEQIAIIVIKEGHLAEIVDATSPFDNQHMERLACFLTEKVPEKTPVFFTGPQAESTPLRLRLEKLLSSHFSMRLAPMKRSAEISHAVAIGLALDGLYADGRSAQFRKTPSAKLKKKRVISLRHTAIAGLCCFLSIGFFGVLRTNGHEKQLTQELQKNFPDSGKSLKIAVQTAQRSVSKSKMPPLPAMQRPNAREALSWLSSHPNLQEVTVCRIRYNLEKFPRLSSPKTQPLIRVELEFSTPSSSLARNFRQALLADPAMIDLRRHVKWTNHENTYKAIFYLKTGGRR